MKNIVLIFFLLISTTAMAITGTVERIVIQAATDVELEETVLEPGLLLYRVDEPKDVRIGDGSTKGGIRLWNYLALTNPPPVYDRDLDMAGHAVQLNSQYRMIAEGGFLSIYHDGTNPVFRLVGSESAGTLRILESVTVGTDIVITVQHVEGDDPPVLEGATDLADPVWTPVEYELERLSGVTITLTFPQPALGVFTYYRVSTSVSDPMANFLVPLMVDGVPVITAETDAAGLAAAAAVQSNLTAHVTDMENPHGVTAEQIGALTVESDPAWMSASSRVVYTDAQAYTAAVAEASAAYSWGDHGEAGYIIQAGTNDFGGITAVTGRVGTLTVTNALNVSGVVKSDSGGVGVLQIGSSSWGKINTPGTELFVNYDYPTKNVMFGKSGESMLFRVFGKVGIGVALPVEALEVDGKIKATKINFSGCPTSTNGLVSGDVWNDGGALRIVP